MSKGLKIVGVVVIAFLLLLSVASFWVVFKISQVDMKPLMKTEEVVFDDLGERVYLRARSWGIGGNHNEVVVSTETINPVGRKSEKESEFIFHTTEVFYKKQGADTLLVYSSSIGKEPKNYQGRVKIVIKRLETYDENREYEANYEKYGLKRIRSY